MASLLGVAACAGPGSEPASPVPATPQPPLASQPPGRTIGVLLPLTGSNARLGQEMLQAIQLALGSPGAPPLDARDTAAPGGATAAARAAVGAGDGVILGPLTAHDTAQASEIAMAASVPVLAYTSDLSLGRPGVWALGIAPEQQVARLVIAAQAEGRQHFAAFLPDNALGRAMGSALTRECAARNLPEPNIIYHTSSQVSILQGLKTLSDYDSRLTAAQAVKSIPQPDASASDIPTPSGVPSVPTQPSAAPASPQLAPPPFDVLLLADTGLQLAMVIDALQTVQVINGTQKISDNVSPVQPAVPADEVVPVRILGTGLWGAFASKLGRLHGAWYAAPDPQARQRFIQVFMARYHRLPTPLSDLSYDSAALVGALDRGRPRSRPNGYIIDALARPDGFAGVDGVFGLTLDGHTLRDLAVFQIQSGGGGRIILPALGHLAHTQS